MNFHETKMGHIFFERQLPQLIQSIQTLTDVLGKPARQAVLPVEADPDFLSELFLGNYEPDFFKNPPEVSAYMQAINAAYKDLFADLSPESQDKLIKYRDAISDRDSAEIQCAYECGFRTAVQMMVAGLSHHDA